MENNPALVVRKIKRVFFFIIVGFLYINSLSLGTSYSFQGFSDISSDYVFQGMSSNGELLISHSNGSSLWTHEDGASNLSGINFDGVEANATYSAETISDGGDLIVGRDISTNTSVLWNPQNGATNLHDLMGIEKPNLITPESVSANGIVVGRISNKNDQGQWYYQAFVYNSQTSNTTILGASFDSTGAYGISKDGTIVTGTYEQNPFWWTQEQGIQLIQHPEISFLQLQEDRVSEVFDISDNGDIMVGWSGSPFESVASIWKASGETIILSDVENSSFATSVSGDGTVVVGHEFLQEANHRIAFIWDELNGKQYLNDVLTSAGIDLGGWRLREALAISSDGSTIIGSGVNPDGQAEDWIAIIPEPTTLSIIALGALLVKRKR